MNGRALEIFTVGHSNRTLGEFLELLQAHRIEVVADVRSTPRSTVAPHFDREALVPALKRAGVRYLFLGEQLGGRPNDTGLYTNRVGRNGQMERYCDYQKVRDWPPFRQGLSRLLEGARAFRIALMCAEKEPLDCHRALLVAEALRERGVLVRHIVDDRPAEDHTETRLRALRPSEVARVRGRSPEEREKLLEQALRALARKVAYRESADITSSQAGLLL